MDKSKYKNRKRLVFTQSNESGMTLPHDLDFRSLLADALTYAQCPHNVSVHLVWADEDAIRRLNREHRAMDKSTDVLSFPQYEGIPPTQAHLTLGDVVVCPQIAQAQADLYGHSFAHELRFLFVHGVLHLLGYDHEKEADEQKMRQAQREVVGHA